MTHFGLLYPAIVAIDRRLLRPDAKSSGEYSTDDYAENVRY
jgi:hypothetical protein